MEHKEETTKQTTSTSFEGGNNNVQNNTNKGMEKSESKGVLGTVWSAAGAIAETVQHAVQGTIDAAYQTADRIQHDAQAVTTMGEYVAHKVVDTASNVYEHTIHPSSSSSSSSSSSTSTESAKHDADVDAFFSSPTDDFISASKSEPTQETLSQTASDAIADTSSKVSGIYESAKQTVSDTLSGVTAKASDAISDITAKASDTISSVSTKAGEVYEQAKQTISDTTAKSSEIIDSAKQSVSDAVENAKQTIQPTSFNLVLTMDVVAHLQRIADRTGDKILHETAKKAHSACAKGLSEAPGVHLVRVTPDQATELVNLAIMTQDHELADFARYCQSVAATTQIGIEPTPGKIMEELAKGRQELSKQGRVHTGPGYGAAFASVGRIAPSSTPLASSTSSSSLTPATPISAPIQQTEQLSSSEMILTMDMVAHIQRIADRTGDVVLHETARKAHSACAKNVSEAPGVHLVKVTPDQASELVNLAIRTQDHELANFARYCQSVAATNQVGIEPTPGKIMEEINKGRQELVSQGRAHTGPGYGAAFASISRSNSSTSLGRSNSSSSLGRTSRSASPTNVPLDLVIQQQQDQLPSQPNLQLTMDVVAHLQRIADRTGDALLHETARKAHSACAKNVNEAPGVHLTWITPEQATELVNLAIRTQDHELADFARYCQSVAATTQVGVEPSPGKIREEIEKGRLELQQLGRTHTGPGYGAAFASAKPQQKQQSENTTTEISSDLAKTVLEPLVSLQVSVGQPSQ